MNDKLWVLGGALLLGWVILSMYFLMSGQPLDLPAPVMAVLPWVAFGLFGVLIVSQIFRGGRLRLPGSNNFLLILAVASVLFLILMALSRLFNWSL
jgi:branched-subunit amino acid transport protein